MVGEKERILQSQRFPHPAILNMTLQRQAEEFSGGGF
jgi:hypothetical protein